MRKVEMKVYGINELAPEARERAVRDMQNDGTAVSDWWYEDIYENIREMFPQVEFESFEFDLYGQGSGACFVGEIKDIPAFIAEVFPDMTEANRAMLAANIIAMKIVKKGGRAWAYQGSWSVEANVDLENLVDARGYLIPEKFWDTCGDWRDEKIEILLDRIEEKKDEICKTLFGMLRDEYEYLTSDENCVETAEANEWEFYEDGRMFAA